MINDYLRDARREKISRELYSPSQAKQMEMRLQRARLQ